MIVDTPLRYPGGKSRLVPFFRKVLDANGLRGGVYAEPFAGGAGVAVSLLVGGDVSEIRINDADRSIFAFWKSVTEHNGEFLEIFDRTVVDMDEWYDEKAVQDRKETANILELGFSTFFLNRTNRSGILSGGVIGGKGQSGKYKIDARFNRAALRGKIEKIGALADKVEVTCEDAVDFMAGIDCEAPEGLLMYIDPPYYEKGSTLYMNHFTHEDHERLSSTIRGLASRWVLSYDDVPEIRRIYEGMEPLGFDLRYSSYESRLGKEVFYSGNVSLPDSVI